MAVTIGLIMIILFALVSEIFFLIFAIYSKHFGLIDLHKESDMLLVVCLLAFLFISYFCTYYFAKWHQINIKIIFFLALIIHITLLFVPYLTSNDLFTYIFQSRVAYLGANPYLVAYNHFSHDLIFNSVNTIWSEKTTLYGPMFLLIGWIINFIGRDNLTLIATFFKLLLVGANLLNIFLIFKVTKNVRSTYLYAFNPLVIFELVGNAHNESLLIFFLLISLLLLIKKPINSFLFYVITILIKYSTFVFFPIYLITLKKSGWKKLIFAGILGILLIIGIYLPFWSSFDIFNYQVSYYNTQFISPSLLVSLGKIILRSYALSFNINSLFFLSAIIIISIKYIFSKQEFKQTVFYFFIIYLFYILTKLNMVLSWYLTPLIALSSLTATWKKYEKYAIGNLIFVSLYSLLLYYFVR